MTAMPSKDNQPAIARGIPLEDESGLGPLTLPGFLNEIAHRHGEKEALVMYRDGAISERWTYEEFRARSIEVAKALIACGIGKDSRVGVLMTNRLEWLSACFGISLAGGTVAGLSTFSTPDELAHLVSESCISMLLFEGKVLKKDFSRILLDLEPEITSAVPGSLLSRRFPYLRRLVRVDEGETVGAVDSWNDFLARGGGVSNEWVDARAEAVKPSDPAILFYSSGSTGKPKGILNSHRGVSIQSWRWPRVYDLEGEPPVRAWSANGLFWSGNWSLILGVSLASGGTLILQSTFDPAEAIRLFEAERVNLPYCWPHQWAQLEERPEWNGADLSSFYYVDAEVMLRRNQTTITHSRLDPRASYGSTETFTISAVFPVNTPEEIWKGSNGEPLPGNTIKIVDPGTNTVLKRGETGEIAVKGPTLMLGYLGVPPEEALDDEGFYRAGDGGYIDDEGRLIFQGRINDIIKTGGANVSPVEVDWTLCSCPGVKVCKTTGVPDDKLGEMVVSLVVAEPGSRLSEEAVISFLKERLASYKVPRKVIFVTEEEIGLTATAKIKPAEARELATKKMAEDAFGN